MSKIKDFLSSVGSAFASSVPSAVSGLLGHFTGLGRAEKQQNAFNAQQAQLNREFQERMSNTSYQRAVADMQQAGLNPQLMYGGTSSGASTPSGASASASGYANRGLQAMQTSLALQKSFADIRLAKAEAKLKEIQANYEPSVIESQIQLMVNQAKSEEARAMLTSLQSAYQSTTNEFQRDVIGLNMQLMSGQVKLNDKQAEQVENASKLIALQQMTETKKWDNLDANTKKLLSDIGVNDANIGKINAEIHRIFSDIEVNESHKELNNEQRALLVAQKIATELQSDKNWKKPDDNASVVEKGLYEVYRVIYNLFSTAGLLFGGTASVGYNKSTSSSTSRSTSTSHVFTKKL